MVVVCSSDQHKGYIPIFREYERPIASLSLDGIQLTRIRNNTFRSLRSIRVSHCGEGRPRLLLLIRKGSVRRRGFISGTLFE